MRNGAPVPLRTTRTTDRRHLRQATVLGRTLFVMMTAAAEAAAICLAIQTIHLATLLSTRASLGRTFGQLQFSKSGVQSH